MKPRTISTLEGLFVLDDSGFYKPYIAPEPKASLLWLTCMGIGTFAAAVLIGAYFVMEAVAGV